MPAKSFSDFFKSFEKEGGDDALVGDAGNILSLATSDSKYKGGQRGKAIGGGLGTIAGSFIGLPGVGEKVGEVLGGLLGGASDKEHEIQDYQTIQRKRYSKLNLSANINPFGNDNAYYMEDGGAVSAGGPAPTPPGGPQEGQEQQQPQRQTVNVQLGEILINPTNLDVVRKYDNTKRYKPHAKNAMDEPVGNFTMIDPGMVVIPKEYASRYEKGDILTRKSIVAQILKEQRNNPEQNAPRSGAPFAKDGMLVEGDPIGIGTDLPQLTPAKSLLGSYNWDTPSDTASLPIKHTLGIVDKAEMPTPFTVVNPATIPNTEKQLPGVSPVGVNAGTASRTNITGNDQQAGQTDAATSATPGSGKLNRRLIMAQALNFLPTSIGAGNSLGTDPFLNYDENTQLDSAKSYIQDMETNPNIEASKAEIRRSVRGRNRTLLNFNSPSVRAETSANNVDVLESEGKLVQDASNMAMDARNRKRQTLSSLEAEQGGQRLNMRERFADELRQDSANRRTMLQAAVSEGVTNNAKQTMDLERIKSINTMTEFYHIDPYQAEMLVDQGVFGGIVNEYLQGRLNRKGIGTGTPTTTGNSGGRTTETNYYDRVGNPKGKTVTNSRKN